MSSGGAARTRSVVNHRAPTGSPNPPLRSPVSAASESSGRLVFSLARSVLGRSNPADRPDEAPPIVAEALRAPGARLDLDVRENMEERLGHDFSRVRVHTDARAAASARAVNALAYTVGNMVVFDRGRFAPHEPEGRTLLAHELVHTIQQGPVGETGRLVVDRPDSPAESDAERTAARASSGPGGMRPPAPSHVAVAQSAPLVQRQQPETANRGARPRPDQVEAIEINLTAGSVVFQFQSGKTIRGTVDTDLEAGSYVVVPDLPRRKWVILGTEPGLRFDVELDAPDSDGSDGPDPWTFTYPKRLPLRVAKGSPGDIPVTRVLGDDADLVPVQGDPLEDPNYVERAVKSVGIPIWGGPFYLYHKAQTTLRDQDAVVLPRAEASLGDDPLKAGAVSIRRVFKNRAAADAAVAAFGVPGAFAFYVGPGGHFYPTVLSDSTAFALCQTLRLAVDDEKKDAKAAATLSVNLALWYAGARFGPKTAAPGEIGEAASAAKQAQQLAAELAKKEGKVIVNLGGTGEVANAINVNPLTAQQVKSVPNLVKAGAEEVGALFKPGTVDSIVSNNVVRGTVQWSRAAKGSFQALKSGGQISIAPYAGDLAAQLEEVTSALKAAGFEDVTVVGEHFVTAVKP